MKGDLLFSNTSSRNYSIDMIDCYSDISKISLSSKEKDDIANILTFRRKRVKVLGKILIKSMYKREYRKEVMVLTGNKGRPYILKGEQKRYNISISHCLPFIVGVIGKGNIGVDIEKIRDYENFQIFFTKKEYDLCMQMEDPSLSCTVVWVLKEAVLKLVGVGFEYGFDSVEIFIHSINEKIDVHFKVNDNRVKLKNPIYFDIYKKQGFICGVAFEYI